MSVYKCGTTKIHPICDGNTDGKSPCLRRKSGSPTEITTENVSSGISSSQKKSDGKNPLDSLPLSDQKGRDFQWKNPSKISAVLVKKFKKKLIKTPPKKFFFKNWIRNPNTKFFFWEASKPKKKKF